MALEPTVALLSEWLFGEKNPKHLDNEIQQQLENILTLDDVGGVLYSLCLQLHEKAIRSSTVEDYDVAIKRALEALPSISIDRPDYQHPAFLRSLGLSFQHRAELKASDADADEAVRYNLDAYHILPTRHENFPLFASSLAAAHRVRFSLRNEKNDINQAKRYCEEAKDIMERAAPFPEIYHEYSLVLQEFFDCQKSLEYIGICDEAIKCSENAIQVYLDQLRHETEQNQSQTESAITEGTSEDLPPGKLNRDQETVTSDELAAYQNALSTALELRYQVTSQPEDITRAISQIEASLKAKPGPEMTAVLLQTLGNVYLSRFEQEGRIEDLTMAKDTSKKISEYLPRSELQRLQISTTRSIILQCSFERTGRVGDLNESVTVLEDFDWTNFKASRSVIEALSVLATSLSIRYKSQGSLNDLDTAISMLKTLIQGVADNGPQRIGMLNNISVLLMLRYERLGKGSDLKLADKFSAAIFSADAKYWLAYHWTIRSKVLVEIAKTRKKKSAILSTLDDAIQKVNHAVNSLENNPHNPDRAIYLEQAASAALERWKYARSPETMLYSAVRDFGLAAETVSKNNPDHYEYLFEMAQAEMLLMQLPSCEASSIAIIKRLETIRGSVNAVIAIKVRSGHALAKLLARDNIKRAAIVLMESVELLEDVVPVQVELSDRQYLLAGFGALVIDAAELMALQAFAAQEVIQTLEQGRGIILSQILGSRSDLDDLERMEPTLAEEIREARQALNLDTGTAMTFATPKWSLSYKRSSLNHAAAQKLRDLKQTVRSLPNFKNFLQPPTDDLIPLSKVGAMVLIHVGDVSDYSIKEKTGAWAHIVQDGTFTSLELPKLRASILATKSKQFHNTLKNIKQERESASTCLKEMMEWLFDVLVEPVLTFLKFGKPKSGITTLPRIWWIVSGPLSGLPLHAAGRYDRTSGLLINGVLDRAVSSYAPTARVLLYSKQTVSKAFNAQLHQRRALLVSMSKTEGQPDLPHAKPEVDAIQSVLGKGTCTILETPDVQTVLDSIRDTSYVHFSCHGKSDPRDPSNSALFLREGSMLNVRTITRQRLENAIVAYLSACETFDMQVETLAEEAIHITSGFQAAGFAHVIGTLWSVGDKSSMRVAETFYRNILDGNGNIDVGGSRVAFALYDAIEKLRGGGLDPLVWVPYAHSGV